jgi:hypothetical protein
VLRDVDLSVEPAEFVAIAGPNGGGKTTLVRLVLGLERPVRGEARLFDQPAHRFSRRAELGYLAQRPHLGGDAPATVREVAARSGRAHGALDVDLFAFLFGSILTVTWSDLALVAALGGAGLLVLGLLYRALVAVVLPVIAATRIAWSIRSTFLLGISIGLASVLGGLTIAYSARADGGAPSDQRPLSLR